MTYLIQMTAVISGIIGLCWIIAGLLASIGEPNYEDEEDEHAAPYSPRLPHHRRKR